MEKLITYIYRHFYLELLPKNPLLGIATESGGVEFEPNKFTPYWQIHFGLIFFKITYSSLEGFN